MASETYVTIDEVVEEVDAGVGLEFELEREPDFPGFEPKEHIIDEPIAVPKSIFKGKRGKGRK